ncbi:MAG: hypothetical protein Kow0099_04380 [Candidatus Abyssubacteria bacterium]
MRFKNYFLVFATLLVLSGCVSLPGTRPEVQSIECRTAAIDFEGTNLAFDIDVFNPSAGGVQGPLVRYAIYIKEAPILELEKPPGTELDASGTTILTLPVRISYEDLWKHDRTLRHASEASFTLRGALVFDGPGPTFAVPISYSGSFPILRPPELTAVKVRLSDVSLSEALLLVDAEVTNPNSFALDIRRLDYSLDLGDVRVNKLMSWTKGLVPARQRKPLTLSSKVSASDGLIDLLMKGVSDTPRITAEGIIETPYGAVELKR